MSDRERTDSGQFAETASLEDVLDVFNHTRGPVITSSDVADQFDCTTEAARQKLTRLYDQGRVDRRKTGRVVVYWRTGDGDDGDGRPAERSEGTSGGSLERTRDVLEEIDVVGRGTETPEVRREAILHAWSELRDRGEATSQELANSAFDEYADHHKFGYGESSRRYRGYTFWDSCARDVLKELPGVEPPPERGNTWYFNEGEL